jgi:hypothetical protein
MQVTLLPRPELDRFLLTVGLAAQLAGAGDAADGYSTLLAGLRRAEEALAQQQPWGEELVARWRRAVDHFVRRHGIIPLDPQPQ